MVGGVGNGVTEEDAICNVNPVAAAMLELNHTVLGVERGLP